MDAIEIRKRMNATGIGLAGLEGVWWLPAAQPFVLPRESQNQLQHIAQAVFALFGAVRDLYSTDEGEACGLNRLLSYKVPPHLLKWASRKPVLAVRPDFQLVIRPAKSDHQVFALVATELEICPSAQGFAHAMQMGYALEPDLVKTYAEFLDGRELLIVCTQAWSEFIWDQLAFCRALIDVGARAHLLFDMPIQVLAEQVKQKQRWVPPMFGISKSPEVWNDDVLARIKASGVPTSQVSETRNALPHNTVIFRFGYLDCFSADVLQRLNDWEQQGTPFLNPTSFLYDSKVIMAALNIPQVRAKLRPARFSETRQVYDDVLHTLDHCIPKTRLLTPDLLPQLQHERSDWVLKFAGFDSGQQAWGGRSVQLGLHHTHASWIEVLHRYLDLPFPVVAQRIAPSMSLDIGYVDEHGEQQVMCDGNTRLRSFFLRDGDDVNVCGTHLTVSGGMMQVSESTAAVQSAIVFG